MSTITALGAYLKKHGIKQKEIADKTGFSSEKVSNLYTEASALLYADEFHQIIKSASLDINDACAEIFVLAKVRKIENKWQSKLGLFLLDHFKPQNYLQASIGLKTDRLSKILTDVNKRPYAEEVYLISKLVSITPSVVFEHLYGEGERPRVGL